MAIGYDKDGNFYDTFMHEKWPQHKLAPGEELTPEEEVDFLNAIDAMEECQWCGEPHDDLVEVEGLMRCAKCRGEHAIRWGRP